MTRKETTSDLSALVERRLSRLTPWWAREVAIEPGCEGRIVDYMAFRPAARADTATDGDVERGTFSFFEVKSCMADFESGHGLNFEGDENYLVCERELADELYRALRLPVAAAVLVPDKSRTRLIEAYHAPGDPYRTGRTRSAAFLLFQIMRRMAGRQGLAAS